MTTTLLLSALLTFVEFNCENLFDYRHDEGKNDYEWLPDGVRKWDENKYWQKVRGTAQAIISCGGEGAEWVLPDLVALTEVENDSVLHDLTHRSPLRGSGYEYVVTASDDERGIDVALLYSPFSFRLLAHYSIHVDPPEDRHATRDILYAKGIVASGDTLHVMVVHSPSRVDGERATRPYRLLVANRIAATADSLRSLGQGSHIIVAGDFNDYSGDPALQYLSENGFSDISANAVGTHGARGTYKHRGKWGSLDHILVSGTLAAHVKNCHVNDTPFLTEEDTKYGGIQPHRTYVSRRYHRGYSDHLPLVATFQLGE